MEMRRLVGFVLACFLLLGGTAFAAPNDPGWSQQWHLPKIRADRAWATSKGSGVIVAIVDTGIDLRHPDLRGRIVGGYDFVDDDSTAQDDNGHGTFMAGIVAATTGNGVGVASVAPAAKLMPVRVLNASGTGDPGTVAEGVRWAVDHGADVINLSLAETSGGGIDLSDFYSRSELGDAITYAAEQRRFVAIAAGNSFTASGGASRTAYDATDAGVLVVGASTPGDRRAAYSNYGTGLDVVAPGGGSATDASADVCRDSPDAVVSTWWDPEVRRSAYGSGCGTSMAVAHVAGVAALLMSAGRSASTAARRIVSTAVDLGTPGWDRTTGNGRVDAYAAVGPASSRPVTARPSTPAKPAPKKIVAAASPKATAQPTVSVSPSPAPAGALAASETSGSPPNARGPLLVVAGLLVFGVGLAHPLARRSLVR